MSLSNLNSIGQTVFELETRNGNVDGQTDGRLTYQSKASWLQATGENLTFKRPPVTLKLKVKVTKQ